MRNNTYYYCGVKKWRVVIMEGGGDVFLFSYDVLLQIISVERLKLQDWLLETV